jgi:hypothetical protein
MYIGEIMESMESMGLRLASILDMHHSTFDLLSSNSTSNLPKEVRLGLMDKKEDYIYLY